MIVAMVINLVVITMVIDKVEVGVRMMQRSRIIRDHHLNPTCCHYSVLIALMCHRPVVYLRMCYKNTLHMWSLIWKLFLFHSCIIGEQQHTLHIINLLLTPYLLLLVYY